MHRITMDRKASEALIKKIIQEDPLAADLQWSFFVSASRSYRLDTVLKPFPPMFMSGEEKNTTLLIQVIEEIPAFLQLCGQIHSLSDEAIALLKWVLQARSFQLKTLNRNEFGTIQSLTGHETPVPSPSFIFEVVPSEQSRAKFEQTRQERRLIHAYHGSRIENFHSILHHGLACHMNKTSLFGSGTYLSSELAVSLNFSPTGLSWELSELGSKLGCVAVCQAIDHPSVKGQLENQTPDEERKSRTVAEGSMGGQVPERYFLVQNNEMLRVKYLLIYSEQPRAVRPTSSGLVASWLQRNKFAVTMGMYCLLLLFVGLSNSSTFKHTLRRLLYLK